MLNAPVASVPRTATYKIDYNNDNLINKPQLTKNKQQNCIGIRAFDSRLYLDSSSSFK
jgi:hypothetical protein